MKKYKKIITGLILGLICAILPFVGVVKAKALTEEEITTVNDLKNTVWTLNETVTKPTVLGNSGSKYFTVVGPATGSYDVMKYTYGSETIVLNWPNNNSVMMSFTGSYGGWTFNIGVTNKIISANNYQGNFGTAPREITFFNVGDTITFNAEPEFLTAFKEIATLQGQYETEEPEPTTRTIPFRISLITNVFGEQLEYINSSIINLPVFDDTVSFTVSFENNKMITGQVEHPESSDEIGELTFSNGERVFYTIFYNETNIDFKLYFYGEQLFLYEAVMYNTEILDSGGNYQATIATYSEGISEQEMETLKNSGIYEASFDITIPQEAELVTDAQLMLEIGILEGSEPPGFDNITNIMTGIFTLVSSFLSIQLGFITLGQIIGLILAIGVIFFIFYVWNGGRNGN